MLTASCPKCAKQVTVPHAARPESRVRCPLCAEEYSLESIFADLPPLLVLLDAPAPNGASGIHEGETREASASEVSGSSNIFDFDEREKQDAQVADEDAVHQVVGAGDQHGEDGGEGVAPEAAGHGPLAQMEVGGHICSLGEFDARTDSLNYSIFTDNQAFP